VLQLYSFDSGYSLVVLGEGGGGIREVQILQPPSPSPADLKIKKTNARKQVIWTSTVSIIRIHKLFVIGN
jgi:hypothetical protein